MPPRLPAAPATAAAAGKGERALLLGGLTLLLPLRGRFQIFQRLLQQPAGRRDVLQQFHVEIEVDDKRHVLFGTQHLLEESVAGRPLFLDQAALAAAGIHQQAQA